MPTIFPRLAGRFAATHWLVCLFLAGPAFAVPRPGPAPFSVRPKRPSGIYAQGEPVVFCVQSVGGANLPEGVVLEWKISKDGVDPVTTGTLKLVNGRASLTNQLGEPGFLQCVVTLSANGKSSRAIAGAAVDPLLIKPSMPVPEDFDAFWAAQKKKLAAVPINPQLRKVNTSLAKGIEAFDVQLDCVGSAPVSGYFALPSGAKPKSLPAFLSVQSAGVHSGSISKAAVWATNGLLAMDINAHGLPNGKPLAFYDELKDGKLKGYTHFGRESREKCYFLGMFLRELRAIDFLTSRSEWDGKNVIVMGGSQGGFQAFAAAGLDSRVTFFAAGVPAGCDHTGIVAGRVNGWPKLVPAMADGKPDPRVLEVARYFDAVNFASRTKASAAFITVGFIDQTCPPTTVYAAYNSLRIPKQIYNDVPGGHPISVEANKAMNAAVLRHVQALR